MKKTIKLFAFLWFVLFFISAALPAAELVPGTKAPKFSMDTTKGTKESLETLVGTGMERSVLVLSFFDTNCQPCLKELPHLKNLYNKYAADREVKIRLIGLDAAGKDILLPHIQKHGINIPVLIDREGLYAGEKYGVVSMGRAKVPKLFVISKNKIIKSVFSGFKEGEEAEFEAKLTGIIEELKKEKVIREFPNNLMLLYSNSTNGYFESCDCPENPYGGLVRRATAIKNIRAQQEELLLVDSGDYLAPYPNKTLGKYIFKMYALLDYDALAVGDQDLINGSFWLNDIIEKQPYGNLPFLSSNTQLCNDQLCWNLTKPYITKTVGKYKVGILGVISPNIFFFYPPDKKPQGLKILNSTGTIKTYVDILRQSEKVNLVILLSHSGADADKKIAAQVPGIDVIVGGHSQTLLETPVEINNTLILQAGENGQRLGKLTLNFDDTGRRVSYKTELIKLVKDFPDDEAIRELANAYKEEIKKESQKLLKDQ